MLDYKAMRKLLKESPEGVKLRHFTEEFYQTFREARETGNWEPVYATDFYKLEGFSYCVFLEVFNASLPLWRLTFGKWDQGWPIDIARSYIREDTEADARTRGEEMMGKYNASYVEVEKVKAA